MVPEGGVLLGVQDLQQGRRRVAPVVAAQLVHLVQQQQGVLGLGLGHGRHNPAGHGADIRLAVAADIGLVMDAAQGDSGHIPVQSPGDAGGHGGLADAGRAHQAENLGRQLRRHLADGENLQNPLLDLLQAEVVLVQDLTGGADVHPLLGAGVPGELQAGVEIRPQHRRLGGVGGLLAQALELLEQLLAGLLGQLQGLNGLVVLLELLFIVALAQLGLDDPQLLPQIIVPLTLVDVLLDLLLNLGLQLEDIQLPAQQDHRQLQPLDRVELLQNLLLLGVVDRGILGDKIGDKGRVPGGQHRGQTVLGRAAGELQEVIVERLGLPDQGFDLGGRLGIGEVRHGLHPAEEEGLHLNALGNPSPVLALHKDAQGVPRQPENLLDHADGAHGVEAGEVRIVGLDVLLGHQENLLIVVAHGLLHGADRLFPPHVEVNGHAGKYVQSPQRQNRQPLGNQQFVHTIPPSSGK